MCRDHIESKEAQVCRRDGRGGVHDIVIISKINDKKVLD